MPKGRLPKPAHLRQRRNKTPGEAQLGTPDSALENEVPELPARNGGWHAMTTQWWVSVWRSPMASEYLDADMKGGLFQLAFLHQLFWETSDLGFAAVNKLPSLAAEIRLQEVRFGLSPIDRSRLRWTIDQGEKAAESTENRRAAKETVPPRKGKDPRSALKMVG
jgi:hypothetical protein